MADAKGDVKGLDAGPDPAKKIFLVSGDGKKFEVSLSAAMMSVFVKTALDMDKNATELDVKIASASTLETVVKYLEHHNGKPPAEISKPLRNLDMKKVVEDTFDADLVDSIKKWKVLFDLVLVANFMDIQSLLNLGCAKIASVIKGRTQEDIKEIFRKEDIPARELPAEKKEDKKN